jgi:DNA polymerase III delta prime subunit
MASMIPPTVHAGTRSHGEIETFRRLRDDPSTKDWIVLHSLDVATTTGTIAGEIDFVIIIPSKGVLCLEVKGCGRLRRHQGQWFYGTDPKPDPRGPFKQAADAMHAIRAYVGGVRPELSSTVFWSAVLFPYVDFSVASEEWQPWQVIDVCAFRSRPIGHLVLSVMESARRLLSSRSSASWFHPGSGEPSLYQCKAIAETLRPAFEFFESPGSRAKKLGDELKQYTNEQYEALDAMHENPRTVFAGPAGTGKTLLAIEAARRGVAKGHKVLLVCFNRLLGKWLGEQVVDLEPDIVCRTLHAHMTFVSNAAQSDRNQDQHYWETELPTLAMKKLSNGASEDLLFDELVVDEAQDLLRDSYLDFLDMSLRGGLASGRWSLFGDFEKQALYETDSRSIQEILAKRCSFAPLFSLRVNCRNTPRVAELVHLLGGLDPPYRRILRPDDGLEPEIHYYSDGEQQERIFLESLQELYSAGFDSREIVVLSPRADKASLAASVNQQPRKSRLRPYGARDGQGIGYCSIYAFKGLESPAIIVTDIEHILDSSSRALFYVATTRALQRLIMTVNSSVKPEMLKCLLGSPREGWSEGQSEQAHN